MADDLLTAAFDRKIPGPPERPQTSYLVCSTPRSGSTLLCEALRGTGALGTPAEYFNVEATVEPLRKRWGSVDGESFVRDLYRHRTTDQGVFGTKLHWQQVEEMGGILGLGEPDWGSPGSERRMLERFFPGATYVHLSRRDQRRQAVSYWLADKTRQWSVHRGEEPAPAQTPEYQRAEIDGWLDRIQADEARWIRFFDEAEIEPLRVVYEDFTEDYAATVVTVAARLGVELGLEQVPPPRLAKQGDARSEAILARYRAEVGG